MNTTHDHLDATDARGLVGMLELRYHLAIRTDDGVTTFGPTACKFDAFRAALAAVEAGAVPLWIDIVLGGECVDRETITPERLERIRAAVAYRVERDRILYGVVS